MGALSRQKSTSDQTQSQQNQYGYMSAPDNKYYQNAEQLIGGYDGGASAVREGYSRNVNDIKESGNEFLGAKTPDYVRDKVKDSRLFRNNMDLGRGLADAKQDEIGFKNQGYMALGAATAPDLVQTGSRGTSSSRGSQTESPLNTVSKLGQLGA